MSVQSFPANFYGLTIKWNEKGKYMHLSLVPCASFWGRSCIHLEERVSSWRYISMVSSTSLHHSVFLFLRLAIWIKIQIMRNLSDDKFIEKYSRYYLTRGLANDHLVIYFSLMHHCGKQYKFIDSMQTFNIFCTEF